MEIILATQNNGKIKEFNELAKGTELNFIPVPNFKYATFTNIS